MSRQSRKEARQRKRIRNAKERKRYEVIWLCLFVLAMASLCVSVDAFKHTYLPWKRHVYQPVELEIRGKEIATSGRGSSGNYLVVDDPAMGSPYSVRVPLETYASAQVGERKKFLFHPGWSRFIVGRLDLRLIVEEDFPPPNPHAPWIVAWYLSLFVALLWCHRAWRRTQS